jgi:hypothetical protein
MSRVLLPISHATQTFKKRYELLCCDNTLYCHKAVFMQSLIYTEHTWHLKENEAFEMKRLLALLRKIWEIQNWVIGKYQNIFSAQRNSAEVGKDTRRFYNELISANPNWPENELVVQRITMDQK